ncbi:MAG TPA: SRPBCC domain-containing protein [Caulobacteraceae bacterium]|jgi:hypothetical protein
MSFRIEHRIGVAAPAENIWELLADVERWPQWNPLYTQAKGKLGIGAALKLRESLPGKPPREFQPVIVDWEPRSQIVWRENGVLARTMRYIEIETLTETGCIFANGAFFHGVAGELQAKTQRRAIFEGFKSLGEAVKDLAERSWRDQSGG